MSKIEQVDNESETLNMNGSRALVVISTDAAGE